MPAVRGRCRDRGRIAPAPDYGTTPARGGDGGRLDAVFFCPHVDDDRCECRKPKPGMLREIGERFHVDLTSVPVVGHTRADMDAALAVGARPFLVRTGYGAATLASYEQEGGVPEGVQVCADLAEVVSVLTD